MVISKKATKKAAVKANSNRINRAVRKPINAADEEIIEEEDEFIEDEGAVDVAPEASDLLFEAEDVAELVSEVSGLPVDVTVDEDEVTFTVGEDTYTVTPEGDEEIVEESTRVRARRIAASRRAARPQRRVTASRKTRK